MSAGFSWKWRAITPFLAKEQTPTDQMLPHMDQKATREEIHQERSPAIHYWQVGPDNSPQEKGEGRWAHWEAGRPIGRPTCPWAPPPSGFDMALSDWLTTLVPEVTCWFHGRGEGGSPLYIWGEGFHFYDLITTSTQHSYKQDVVSFCCRGLRTRGVWVQVVVRGLRVFMESPVYLLLSLYVIL